MLTAVVATSLMYFPIELMGYSGMNSKKVLAVVGLAFLFFDFIKKKALYLSKDFLLLILLSIIVSFCGIFSVTYNNTPDYAYATYCASAAVWLGAAYAVCRIMQYVHGMNGCTLLINYLVAVCIFQCVAALLIDLNPDVKAFVDAHIQQGQDFLNSYKVERLYGIGAALDVAGIRFSAVIIMIAYILANNKITKTSSEYLIYSISIFVIGLIGNMIARTTTVGILISMLYLLYVSVREFTGFTKEYSRLWKWLSSMMFIGVVIAVYFYQTNPQIKKNIRFGFEGFFNYVETGKFSYDSNETLKSMYVWPDNLKTWVIGDGYFDGPQNTDPYYTGREITAYYKGTDVGYLRFIYYFGLVGLFAFSFFIYNTGRICSKIYPEWKILFIMLLILHFSIWFKVATDTFLIFALFLCLENEKNGTCLSDSRNV